MIFWTLLVVSLLVMVLLYLLFGYQKVWRVIIIYGAVALGTGLLFYHVYPGLYTLDLLAFVIPYLVLFPLHFSVTHIINYYVLPDDNKPSKYFIAFYNRILNILGLTFIFLIVGLLMSLADILNDGLKVENIWSISVTVFVGLIVLYGIISLGYKKKFSFVLIVGKAKKVYKMTTTKSRLLVEKALNGPYQVNPRGVYQESGEMQYLYYLKDEVSIKDSLFVPYKSDLYDYIKVAIESHEALEEKYTEYIDQKSSL